MDSLRGSARAAGRRRDRRGPMDHPLALRDLGVRRGELADDGTHQPLDRSGRTRPGGGGRGNDRDARRGSPVRRLRRPHGLRALRTQVVGLRLQVQEDLLRGSRVCSELLVAVRTVWASIWNDRAYEARAAAGISQIVYPAVLIQQGMNSESSGVLITSNPFNPDDPNAVYINAKRGLGIRVVDGYKVAEQILFNPANASLRILTRSADDTALTFSPTGGIREVRVETGRAVLTDDLIRRLSRVAAQLERHFGVGTLDIEWLTIGDRIYVVQARPYAGTSSSS